MLEAPSALAYTAGLAVMLAGVVGPLLYMGFTPSSPTLSMYTQHVRDDELQLHQDHDMQIAAAYDVDDASAATETVAVTNMMLHSPPRPQHQGPIVQNHQTLQQSHPQPQQQYPPPQQLQRPQQLQHGHWAPPASHYMASTAAIAAASAAATATSLPAQAGLPSPAVVLAPLLQARQRWLKPVELQALLLHARASNYLWYARAGGAAAALAAATTSDPAVSVSVSARTSAAESAADATVVLPLLSTCPPVRPRPGSIFLYSKAHVPRWRKDGFAWIGGDKHNNLKLQGVDILTCYYAKCAESAAPSATSAPADSSATSSTGGAEVFLGATGSFQRRGYCLMRDDADIILVHYLDASSSSLSAGVTAGAAVAAAASSASSSAAVPSVKLEHASINGAAPAVAIDLTQYLPYFFPQCGPVRPPPVVARPIASAYSGSLAHARLQPPANAKPPLLRVISPRRFLAEPQHFPRPAPQPHQQQQHQPVAAATVTLAPTLTVLDYAPASDWMEGGSKMLLVLTAAAAAAPLTSSLFLHFVRANPSGLPVSVGCSPLEHVAAPATGGGGGGELPPLLLPGVSASFRARVPAVAHAGAFYALYVSDAPLAPAAAATSLQPQQPTMISTLLPFEYRSRDGVVHDLRTLAPIGRATTSVSVQQSTQQQQPHPPPPQQQQQQQQQQQTNHSARYRPSPSPSPLSFDTSSEQQQQQHVTSSGTTVSVPPLAADYTESNVNLERECIIGLLRRLQSMERAVELSSAATTAPGSSGRSVVSAALSLADVEAAILDSAGEDLIESLLMASLHNIAELDAATATAAVAAGAPMAQGKGYLSPPSNNGGAVSSSMFAAALSKRGSGSALHAAAMRSATPSVSPSLLELASARDSAGRQLVHFVAGLGYTSLLSVLLSQLSADVNSQDHSHRTPLHYAVLASDEFEGGGGAQMSAAGSPAALMVSALLSFGADDRLMDRAGRTALALADLHGRRHIVQVFLEVQNAESLEFDTVAHASSSSSQPHHQQQQQQQRGGDPAQRHHAHPASIETGSTSDNGNRDRSIALTAPATTASQRPGAHEFLSVSSDTEEEEGGGVDEDGSDDNDDDDDDEQMYAAAAASAFAAPSSSNGTSVHAVSGSNISAGATATMSSNGTNASPSAPSSSSSSFPLDRAFSSLTLHDMGISQATLASFDAPLGAADLFSSSTPAFARVVRKVQRQIRWWLFRRHVAAQKLQSVARGMLARRGLKRLRESAQVIQSAFKARKVRRDFVQLRRATKFIQDKFRHARGGGGVSPMSASAVGGGGGGGNASAGSTGPSTTPASANMMRPHLLRPISLSIGPGITSGGGGAESGGGGGESSSIRGASATPAAAAAGGGGSASESESATVERKRSRYLQPPPALQHTSIPSVHDSNLSGDEAGRPLSSLGGLPFRFSPTASMLLSSSAAASSSTVAAAAASSAADGGHGSMSPDALSLLLPDTDADADGEPRSLSLSLAPPLPSSSDATGEDEAGAATSGPFFTLPSMLQLDDPHILAMQLHEPGQLVSPALRSLSRTHQEASAASGHATHMLVQ